MTPKPLSLLLLLSLAVPLAGCAGTPSVDQVRWEIERRVPDARFEPEVHIRLGRLRMGLLRSLLRMVPDEGETVSLLREVDRLEVATYRVESLPNLAGTLPDPRFEDRLLQAGWTTTLRQQDGDSRTWLFTRADDAGSMRNLYVVALDPSELTLVRLDGRLDRAFAEAVADDPDEVVRIVSE